MLYRAVVRAVLSFGVEAWFFLVVMSRKLEGVHVSFLRHMTGQKVKRQKYGTWRGEAEAKVLKEAVTHTLGTYIEKLQATVA